MMGARTCAAEGRAQLQALVPAGHLLRRVDRALDPAGVRDALAAGYSPVGRPSVDPELLLRLLPVGYLYGITSERRLVEEVRVNAAWSWSCPGLVERRRLADQASASGAVTGARRTRART